VTLTALVKAATSSWWSAAGAVAVGVGDQDLGTGPLRGRSAATYLCRKRPPRGWVLNSGRVVQAVLGTVGSGRQQ
jgi:hypothetical protein